jgi:hypothetical protein
LTSNVTLDANEVMKMNELFRTFNMYENIEPLSDEIKVFQCEEADETSSINSALSAMSLRSIANSRCNDNVSTVDDIQQRLKRIHQMIASRKEMHDNEEEPIAVSSHVDVFHEKKAEHDHRCCCCCSFGFSNFI